MFFSVHQESAISSAIIHNDTEGHMIHRASPLPSDVASIDTGLQQVQQEYITSNRRDSGEYDPSIWDFLSQAPVDNDEDDSEDDDDEDDDNNGGGSETVITFRSPREVDIRSIKHAQAIQEIVETEISYSNDLAIIKRVCNVIYVTLGLAIILKNSVYRYSLSYFLFIAHRFCFSF